MVNPDEITNYNRTKYELEEFMIFAICAAGKNANTTATILNKIFAYCEKEGRSPLNYLGMRRYLPQYLKRQGIGCYNNRTKTIRALNYKVWTSVDFLETATLEELEEIHGIGPKTSRFFLMHSRPNQRYAALDTHILKELNAQGVPAPKSTPAYGRRYKQLEQEFVRLADVAQMSVADYDLFVWKKWRKKPFDTTAQN